MSQQYPEHNYAIDIPGEMSQVNVDPVRLDQIVHNLVDNAGKFSPAGSKVRVFARQENANLVFGVSDQGPGIAPEKQKHIFEPFEKLGTKNQNEGIGLGLVVCKRLVEAHSGRIWMESKPGEGSTFRFTIPLGKEKTNHKK